MKAARWYGAYDVRVEDIPDPKLREADDVIVRVTASAICGTDLHPYRGRVPDFVPGTVLGHEFAGVIEEAGPGVHGYMEGNRVVVSDLVVDDDCWYCGRGWYWQCLNRTMFGWGPLLGEELPGGQAEYVRVPHANRTLFQIPAELDDEQALFAGDILATGYVAALNGGIQPGDTVAVVGCGPVGLLAQLSARLFAPARLFAFDVLPARLELARSLGSDALCPDNGAVAAVRAATDGRGADVVLECVGSVQALEFALSLMRRHATISVVGAHFEESFPWPVATAFDNEYTLRFGAGDPLAYGEQLLGLLRTGVLDPTGIISHRLPLEDTALGYQLFDRGEASKVVLRP
jgi:threonine dehydrogenase-like Zn-dependent dehydrogenase